MKDVINGLRNAVLAAIALCVALPAIMIMDAIAPNRRAKKNGKEFSDRVKETVKKSKEL